MKVQRLMLALAAATTSVALTLSSAGGVADAATRKRELAPQWPGHVPGKVWLGMSCGSDCTEEERQLGQPYGVHRQFSGWGNWDGVARMVRADHAVGRLPWVSVKAPGPTPSAGWSAIANGYYDSAIRDLARQLKLNDARPIILTFHHEPSNDGTEAQGSLWARAYTRMYDVLQHEGALSNVTFAPILCSWLFNPMNRAQDPANWVTPAVLSRSPFLGVDVYENDSGETIGSRLQGIIDWMARQGFPNKMVGVGEMGGTDARYSKKSGVEFLNESLEWARLNTDKIGVISYFNSTANSREGVYWPLDESYAKLETFRSWLDRPRFLY